RAQPRRHVLEVRAPVRRAIAGTEGPISTSLGVILDGGGFVWAMVLFTTKARRHEEMLWTYHWRTLPLHGASSCLRGEVKRSSYQSSDYDVRTDMIPAPTGVRGGIAPDT